MKIWQSFRSIHSDVNVDIDIAGEQPGSLNIKVKADSDNQDKDNPKSQISADMILFAGGVEMLFGAKMRFIDDVAYFKIGPVPFLLTAQYAMLGLNLDDWLNKWFRFDPQELGMSFGRGLSEEDEEEMEKISEVVEELLEQYPILKFKKKLAGETIEGVSTYHYLFIVDKENLKPFLAGVFEVIKESNLSMMATDMLTEEEENELFEDIDKGLEKIGELGFEIWIGKKDYLIYKVAENQVLDMPEDPEGTADIDWEILFSQFNEPIEIVAPAESQNIMELLMPFLQMFMPSGSSCGPDDMFCQ